MNQSNTIDQTRARLIQLFRYVQAFNQLQNPVQREIDGQPWRMWFADLPTHPSIRIGIQSTQDSTSTDTRLTQKDLEQAENTDSYLLKVSRPELTDPPQPPQQIKALLKSNWSDPLKEVEIDARIEANPDLSLLYKHWKKQYDIWVEKEIPALQARQIFDRFYELRNRLERETEQIELMVGDGILSWKPHIYHPILLMRVQLNFNPRIPEFTLCETEQPPELYTTPLQNINDINSHDLSSSRQEFEQQHWHPLGGEQTTEFFQRFIHQISPKGRFVAQAVKIDTSPIIYRSPVIFVRKRTLGFSTAIEAILDDLPQRQQLSYALTSLVGVTGISNNLRPKYTNSVSSPSGEDINILLSKPANAEQFEIAQKLEHNSAVLVQGPPGTGKTHTIANLLGHLLAQGKSVLVTSHTSKALKVLHEKIVPPLQPLCVSMLEDDNRRQMERAIDAITERLSQENPARLEKEAKDLLRERTALIELIHNDREDIKVARNVEYELLVVDGQQYTSSQAARYIVKHTEDQWIYDVITLEIPLPLSLQEFTELYHTNITVSPQNEQDLIEGLPDLQRLPTPVEFEQQLSELSTLEHTQQALKQEDLSYRSDLWHFTPQQSVSGQLKELQDSLKRELTFLLKEDAWRLTAMQAGREGKLQQQVWEELISKVEQVNELAQQNNSYLYEYNPVIPDDCLPERREVVLQEILDHLIKGKKLNTITLLIHQAWKTLIQKARVNDQPPTQKEHFVALQSLVVLQKARKELVARWQRQIAPLGAYDAMALGQKPELICYQYVPQLRECLEWYPSRWLPLEQQLQQQGLLWEKLLSELPVVITEHGQILQLRVAVLKHLPALLATEEKRREYAANEAKLRNLKANLQRIAANEPAIPPIKLLRLASEKREPVAYKTNYNYIVDLHERQKDLIRRQQLLPKLEQSAPNWAADIRTRRGRHGEETPPTNINQAWRCCQFRYELDRRANISLDEVQKRIEQNTHTLHQITADLVEKKAWAAQIRRITLEQQRALQGWKELMRKVGKGTGKRAPQLLAQARQLIPKCQTAVPVWIMPLNRVVQNFDPRKNSFDVIIIDEASQADIKALAALYMGKQIVIVGDHEQVTPLAVGQNLDQVDKLIKEYLNDIPLNGIYDGKLSIYGLAQTTFKPICLREHFRCVSPIIQFSNMLSYDGKIKPLRDDSEVQIRPATIAYRVKSSEVSGHINETEALTIASLVVAASQQKEYRNATMGVISMVHEDQALCIDTLLRKYLSVTEYNNRQILCGTAAQFQGDERDVMFLSMVDTPRENGPLMMRDEDARDFTAKKRFNVAVSRARDQLWVVHSLDPDRDLKQGDIRKKLIQHALHPQAAINQLAEQEKRTESEFERQVLRRLVQAGYHIIPQWPVGAYRIDLVVEGNGKRLAVECDGDRWHPIEKLEEDMARQAILERLGWRFVRIRGSQFFRNPEKAMEPVFARLKALEIWPEEQENNDSKTHSDGETLKQQVIRRAAELRQAWLKEQS